MPRAVGRVVFLVVVVIAMWSRVANAAPSSGGETLALESTSSSDAEGCPDRDVLRARVAERLGRDPFTAGEEARGKLRVAFARSDKRHWTAAIELLDAENKRVGGRSIAHEGATCEPLVGSVVLTIAVLLEDLAPVPPPSAPAPAPPPTAPAPPPTPTAEVVLTPDAAPARPPPPKTARFDVAAGVAGALGGAPSPSAGAELALGLDVGRWTFELGGRGYLPASSEGSVAVRARVVHARFAPCWGAFILSGCFVADVGSVSAEAVGPRVTDSRLEAQLYAAGGLGLLSRVFVVDDLLFVRASIDLLFAATRAGFDVGSARVWTVPVVSAAGALALGVRLP
jgi:hypothetical protein